MINKNEIMPDAPVVCSMNGQFAIVDHMESDDTIKLKKDKQGVHHYIPLSWVKKVDEKVHIDRTGDQAMHAWSTSPPKVQTSAIDRATNEGMKNSKHVPDAKRQTRGNERDDHVI